MKAGERQVTRRVQLWKLLFVFFAACAVAGVTAWGILLTSFCTNPRTPVPETQHVIAYNCHGMTVFVTPLENAMRYWLIPALEVLFISLSMLAAVMLVRAVAEVRVDVQIHIRDASNKKPES